MKTSYVSTVVLQDKKETDYITAIRKLRLSSDIKILSKNKAFEVQTDKEGKQDDIIQSLQAEGIKADICIQPAQNRRKKLLICDMDSTLIGQECIDELADFVGKKPLVSAITERAMRGEIEFSEALIERVSLLEGLPVNVLQQCFDERIKLNEGAITLCKTMKAYGARTVIVSGGFTFFSERVANLCGFDTHHANILLMKDDILTGQVKPPILGRDAKRNSLTEYSRDRGGSSAVLAIGDGANDLAMIEEAGLGVAYFAKPAVASAAQCAINYTDLTTALYFQGYSDHEFK